MRSLLSSATTTKVVASVALVAGAATVAGLGTFGAFTSTTSATESVGTGKVVVNMSSQAGRGFDVAATDLVPGDTVQRAVQLTRDGVAFGSLRLTTTAETANALTSDATHGLQLAVDRCTSEWVKAPNSNALTCAGTTSPVLGSRPVIGANQDLADALGAVNGNAAAANLRFTLTLPETAGNAFQSLANRITFTFDATQRNGQAR